MAPDLPAQSKKFIDMLSLDPENLKHVLLVLTYEYVTYLHRFNELAETEAVHLEEIERYVSYLFATLSKQEFATYGKHFRVFYGLKYYYQALHTPANRR